jgi:hypothetical protein
MDIYIPLQDKIKKVKLVEEGDQSNVSFEEGECSDSDDKDSLSSEEDNIKSSSCNDSKTEKEEGSLIYFLIFFFK